MTFPESTLGSYADAPNCTCFPGLCRGGEVINGKLANGSLCKEAELKARKDGLRFAIGDIHSNERGSGARANGGKPDFSLIPLDVLAASLDVLKRDTSRNTPVAALESLGVWQRGQDPNFLLDVLTRLGPDGWEECARVFEYGRRKYAAWNWAKGMPWSVPLACAARHLVAMHFGLLLDNESGLPHRGHVFCNVVMLLTFLDTYPEGNDLPPLGLLSSKVGVDLAFQPEN